MLKKPVLNMAKRTLEFVVSMRGRLWDNLAHLTAYFNDEVGCTAGRMTKPFQTAGRTAGY